MRIINKIVFSFILFIVVWQIIILFFRLPNYILPTPLAVILQFIQLKKFLLLQMIPTLTESIVGFILGSFLGCTTALTLVYFQSVGKWFLPLILISQALPTFAIAPLFVLWFGYGEASKIAMTMLMLFFPVTSTFYDGLQKTPVAYRECAQVMNSKKWREFWLIRIPAALPNLATGLRLAATFAPMGAIIGEWVGSSQGLGYLMLNANAQLQIDVMFAALFTVMLMTLIFYFIVDFFLKRYITW